MIKIGDKKITVAMAREFFKVTESKPEDLIAWLDYVYENRTWPTPCFMRRYKGSTIFVKSSESNFTRSKSQGDYIGIPVRFPESLGDPLTIWNVIKYDRQKFNKFIKFLKGLKL